MARIIPANSPHTVDEAVAVLSHGGVIIFPTETVYGIGADLRQPGAIERIFAIKKRVPERRLLIHCADEVQLKMAVREIPEQARALITAFLPGPLALILERSVAVPDIVTAGGKTVGVRIVASPLFYAICTRLGAPLAATSANLSGNAATNNFTAIERKIVELSDLSIDAGISGSGIPSTIVDLTTTPPVIRRQGEISKTQVQAVLNKFNTDIQF
jgi:L-threonylcarbamoyladenylate synthase|uniref:L-threonylcarbamoyladenylate synthase n=1 Tax=candidate division WOR-3 bacterium TaxID=2052148 RepID=A0A7V3PTJ1_UNCW3